MEWMRDKIRSLSLKKALLAVSLILLGITGICSAAVIWTASGLRQKLLEQRPLIVTAYTVEEAQDGQRGVKIIPEEYGYGPLSGNRLFFYWTATALMVVLPVGCMAAGSAVVAAVYYRLKLKAPLGALREGMEHISREDLDFRLGYTSEDELGRLCGAFEQMRSALEESSRRTWEMLQERKALTASVSHDVRTPVTVIKGYADYLERALVRDVLTEETLETTLRAVREAAERLERYADCVNHIQKIEDTELRAEAFDVKEFTDCRVREFRLLAHRQGLQVCVQVDVTSARMVSDRELLTKILENMFSNALRYAEKRIGLCVVEQEDSVLFSIRDDGRGFTREELDGAASLFYHSPVNGGTFGIGLSICKILCARLGGTLRLGNHPKGGAVVTAQVKKHHDPAGGTVTRAE